MCAAVRATPALTQLPTAASVTVTIALALAGLARAAPPANDYPTAARVEYVQECMARSGALADLYKCSCVIDQLADHLTYDEFVEAATFAHYSSLGGAGGGIFRDSKEARERAKLYRGLEAQAYQHCGLGTPPKG
jgi:hypothetical protein